MTIPDAVQRLLEQEQEFMRAQTGLHDWTYKDLPKLSVGVLEMFRAVAGDENLRWLSQAEYRYPNGSVAVRGQVMISPAGMENLRQYGSQHAS